MKIKEIIVVEGRDDTRRIQEAVDADTIETNGSAIDEEVLQRIEKAQQIRGVIVMTDPDFPGGKIRETISQRVPDIKHAFLKKADCQSPKGGSLGIEHASTETIRKALEKVYTTVQTAEEDDNLRSFLLAAGFIGKPHSAHYRDQLGDALRIGHTNGKQLLKRLQSFQVTQEEVRAAMIQMGIPLPEEHSERRKQNEYT